MTFYRILLAFALTAHSAAALSDSIPEIINTANGGIAWVSSTRALDDHGALRRDVLGRYTERLHKNAVANGAACRRFIGAHPGHFEPTSSLDALATHAATIVSGHVVAAAEGFLHGMPGTLLRIAGTQLKGKNVREVYLFYPYARITTASGTICAKPVAADYTPPRPGDRLVVFSMPETHLLGNRMILHVDVRHELVHQSRDGVLRVPAALRSDAASETFEELERRITKRVRDAAP